MDNWAIAYLSLETIIMVSFFGFVVVLVCLGSVFNNGKKVAKNEPYMSRRQRVKKYNRKERKNEKWKIICQRHKLKRL